VPFWKTVLASFAAAALAHGGAEPAAPYGRQTPSSPAPDGAISGVVVDGSTGQPVADAIVAVAGQTPSQLPAGYQARHITDAKGRFAFVNLPNDGTFQITAAKFGYLDGGYGRTMAPTDPLRPIVIASGAWVGNLRVTIWRPGVIAGMVRDESGEPQVGVLVRVLARIRVAGRDELAAGPLTVTDDLGRYRMSGLLPGRYIVQVPSTQMSAPGSTRVPAAASNVPEGAIDVDDSTRLVIGRYPLPPPPANGRAMAYPAAFHPAATSPALAATIDLQAGAERSGIDVSLTPVPGVRVSGTVEGPSDAFSNLTLRLLPAGMENLGLGAETATALVGPDGAFTFINVPAGAYVLDAPMTFNEFSISSGPTIGGGSVGTRGDASLPAPPPRQGAGRSTQETGTLPGVGLSQSDFRAVFGQKVPHYTGRAPITVGGSDMSGVVLRLKAGLTMRGKLTVESDPAKPGAKAPFFFALMDPAGGQPSLGQPRNTSSIAPGADFEIQGIQAGEYFLRVQAGGGWQVKSIIWRGRDYTLVPFDAAATDDLTGVQVTVTNALPILSGAVRASDGTTPESGLVVLFPADSALWQNTGLWSPRLVATTMLSNGTYRFAEAPAGEYLVAAIGRARLRTWRDPDFLRSIERQASRVSLGWGQTVTRDVTVLVAR
jgi:hypothetical protein